MTMHVEAVHLSLIFWLSSGLKIYFLFCSDLKFEPM